MVTQLYCYRGPGAFLSHGKIDLIFALQVSVSAKWTAFQTLPTLGMTLGLWEKILEGAYTLSVSAIGSKLSSLFALWTAVSEICADFQD